MSENKPHKVKCHPVELPNGFRENGRGAVKVSVAFDDAQYDALRDYAFVHNVSFAEAVRRHLTVPETSGRTLRRDSAQGEAAGVGK